MGIISSLLVGKAVNGIETTSGVTSLTLEGGAFLNIYNRHIIYNVDVEDILAKLCKISSVTEDKKFMYLNISPRGTIQIGVTDADFFGPEGMNYKGSGGELVVWP